MRFDGLDLNLLVALDALLSERSVTGASRRLKLSQPATSAAIGRLRDYFGDELFTMVGRRLMPTPLALSLEQPTRAVLVQIRATLSLKPAFDAGSSTRRFRLIVSDYASIVLMNAVLARVYRDAPGITFELIPFEDLPDDPLRRGEVDFLIFPDAYLTTHHPKEHLFSDEFCCVAWTGSRKIRRRLTLAQYRELGHVTARFGQSRLIAFEERELLRLGIERRIEVVVQNFAMMAAMVVGTDRLATMHRRLAHLYAAHLPLRLLPMPVRIPEFRETLQWPAHLEKDPASIWLRQTILDVASGLDGEPAPLAQTARRIGAR